jgi:DNA-binding NtrC family response regulator
MTPQVLVLSSDRSKGETLVAALKPAGLRSKVIQVWPEAMLFLTPGTKRVFLYDSDFSIAPAQEVLSMASGAKLPVIVMGRGFDASEWVALFRDGAYDVLRMPAAPRQLLESVEAAMKTLGFEAVKETFSWTETAVEWARSRFSHFSGTRP